METEVARTMVNKRHKRGTPPPVEHTRDHDHDHENGKAEERVNHAPPAKKARERVVRPLDERTHFTFQIELPLEWQGALKRASIDAQEDGEFVAGARESDVNALLRYKVKTFCEDIVEESRERRRK